MKNNRTGNGVQIDKGIPLPPPKVRGGRKYPWDEMEVGDSFLYEKRNPANTCAQANKKLAPKRFDYWAWNGKYRIWRVDDQAMVNMVRRANKAA